MTRFRTRHVALVLSIAALAVAGCGSSSKSKTTPAAPATPSTPSTASTGTSTAPAPKSGFAAQLNALCKQGNEQARSAGNNLPKVAAIAEGLVPKFEALTPPPADKAAYEEFIANTKAEIAAAKKNDKAALQNLVAKEHSVGQKLGAPACA